MPYEIKKDGFRAGRGGHTRILKLTCSKCDMFLCNYQKDGPGHLRRVYFDRMIGFSVDEDAQFLCCLKCDTILGMKIVYEEENRLAYRLFVDAINQKIVSKGNL